MSQAPPAALRHATPRSPFIGLTNFTEEYADFFFGRESERNVIIANLRASRLTLLYAESGVGKSSLLRAGVAVRLRELARRLIAEGETARFIPVILSSWSDDPTAGLIDAIGEAIAPFVPSHARASLPLDSLEAAIEAATTATSSTLLIILDQFEEYFLYREKQADDNAFADQLARCINRPDLGANFLISVREDAYAGIGDVLKSRVANVYGNYLHLEYLDERAAREAIVKPVEQFNRLQHAGVPWNIEPRLIDAVLADVQHEARAGDARGAQPTGKDAPGVEPAYLQLIMERLWDEEQARGSHSLRLETLERLGGAEAIVSTHVGSAMETLPAERQDVAARLLRHLISSRGKEVALTAGDLSDRSDLPEAELEPILRSLSAGDLKILRPVASREPDGPVSYEIFHDSLARPLRDWRSEHERTAKEAAQQEAREAAAREAAQRRKKRTAFGLAGFFLACCVAALLTALLAVLHAKDDEKFGRQSIESAARISRLSAAPTFGPGLAAITGLAADRRLRATFEARGAVLAQLQTNPGLPKIAVGHTRAVTTMAFLPRSRVLASGSLDATVRLWDRLGRPVGSPLRTSNGLVVRSVAVSPNGKLLAAGQQYGVIDLWDVSSPRKPRHLKSIIPNGGSITPDAADTNAVAFSRNGVTLAAGNSEGKVTFWDVTRPRDVQPYVSFILQVTASVNALAFDPNPAHSVLAVAGHNDVRAYEVPEHALDLATPPKPVFLSHSPARSIAFAPDSSLAWADTIRRGITLLTQRNGIPHRRFINTTDRVNSLAFADRGRILVSGGDDWSVTTWDVKAGRRFGPPRTQQQAHDNVNAVAVSSDGREIAASGDDRLVKLWPMTLDGALAKTIGGSPSTVANSDDVGLPGTWGLAVGPHAQVAAAAAGEGVVIWSLDGPRNRAMAPAPLQRIPPTADAQTFAVAWRGDILAASQDGASTLYDTGRTCRTPQRLRECRLNGPIQTLNDYIFSLAFDAGGHLLAAGGGSEENGRVGLWDISNPRASKLLWRAVQPAEILQVAFSPTSQLLAAADADGSVRLWDVHEPSHPARLGLPQVGHGNSAVTSIAFSPDGRELVSGGQDQQVVFWKVDPERGLEASNLTLFQTDAIRSLAFSPDGKTLAVSDSERICLYDVESRQTIGGDQCLLDRAVEGTTTGSLAFARGGAILLSAGEGDPIVAWSSILWNRSDDSATLRNLTLTACSLTSHNPTAGQWNAVFEGTKLANRLERTCPVSKP